MSTLQKYILVSAVFLLYITSVPAQGQINVLEYFPLNIGDVFTYDDSSRAEITRTVELDWLDNVTAYEKVWTINPNPEMTDVRHYFIISGDSLFLASGHGTQDNVAVYGKFDPPVLMGTANTTPGDTLTTAGIIHGVEESTGLPVVDSSIVQVVVNQSGPVSVPYGTFDDCITMTVTLMLFDEGELDEEENDEILNVILAKGIGIIYGAEIFIASELAPVHSLVDYRSGGELIDVPAYMPLNIGDVFIYDDSSRAEITRTVELDWLDNVTAYEKVWTNNPNPQITDVRHYFIISGDSLFLASAHGTQDNVAVYGKFDPPVLVGTANTTPGDTLTTVGITHNVEESTGLPVVDSSVVQVVVNRSGLESVPYGTFEDCITMTVILLPLDLDEEGKVEILNVILAKDIGIIYGSEWVIATDLAPFHSLSDFQQGVTPQGDVNENGKVDIFDLLELLKVLGGSSQATEGADVNEDGKVDIFDLLQLLKILSGSTVSLASTGSKLSGTYKGMEYEFGERFKITFADGSKMEFSQNISSPEEIQATGGIAASISDNAEKFESSVLPKNFSLAQNHPNPFNPTTTISYTIPDGAPAHVTLKIYSLRGHLVKTLVASIMDSGIHIVFWDGTDESGRQVSSGVYFYRMKVGEFVQTRKMVILK